MAKAGKQLSALRTVGTFLHGRACSDTLFHVLNRAFGQPLLDEEVAVPTFAGGIMQHGFQCGMLWGAALAAGAQAYRVHGPGPQAETSAVLAAQKLVRSFRAQTGPVNCVDITDLDKSSTTMEMIKYFLIKGGSIGCFRMAAKYAPAAFEAIDSAVSAEETEIPPAPVSCAALVARKLGESDLHTVMAAGLAGGIGLCGGACGALGAAIWINGLRCHREQGVDNLWKDEGFNARFADLMDRFLKQSGFEFECAKITGRDFENVGNHAAYLRDGGCAKIIEELAAQ
ncbi:MAG: C-GCAxxG-C-C family (seleno)protein [Candidatus Neomarinimicrobiota bacterium]